MKNDFFLRFWPFFLNETFYKGIFKYVQSDETIVARFRENGGAKEQKNIEKCFFSRF